MNRNPSIRLGRPARAVREARPARPGRLARLGRLGRLDGLGGLDRLDRAIAALVAILVGTLIIAVLPGVSIRVAAPGLDVAFDTVTTLVTLAVAALAWARFSDRGQSSALYEAAAFLVLSLANAIAAVMALATLEGAGGAAVVPFSEGSLYVAVIARILAAALLVAGEARISPRLSVRLPRVFALGRPGVLALAPSLLLLGLVALAALGTPLPPLLAAPSASLGNGAAPGSGPGSPALPAATSANVVLQVAGAVLLAAAAVLARRRARGAGAVSDRYLAVGLVVAAFAQLHLTLFPSAYAGVMTGGDLLYLVFDLILLLGIEAETRAYVVSLRQANIGLQRLREAEVERAAIEERARLSRELHDGLAQDLWLAKLKVGRLNAVTGLAPEARALCAELDHAIDAGLAEARQAVMALRLVGDTGTPFVDLLARCVDDFADRFGLRAEFECPDDVPRMGARAEAELLRIAQEALNNVRRHADATVVWVRADVAGGRVVVTVRDNGRGFDPAAAGVPGFGLLSMRERATLIGGHVAITSRPLDGTVVAVDVALPAADPARDPVADPAPDWTVDPAAVVVAP